MIPTSSMENLLNRYKREAEALFRKAKPVPAPTPPSELDALAALERNLMSEKTQVERDRGQAKQAIAATRKLREETREDRKRIEELSGDLSVARRSIETLKDQLSAARSSEKNAHRMLAEVMGMTRGLVAALNKSEEDLKALYRRLRDQ
jgi:chromosome segregation ATPase